jgi:hypothetical protein
METVMSSAEIGSEGAGTPPVDAGEMKLEVVVLSVSDVDPHRARNRRQRDVP